MVQVDKRSHLVLFKQNQRNHYPYTSELQKAYKTVYLANRHNMMGTVSKLYVSNNTWIYVYIKKTTKFQLQFQLPRVSTPIPTPGVSTPTPTPASLLNINSNSNSGGFNSNSNSNSGVGVGVEPNSNSNSGVDPNPALRWMKQNTFNDMSKLVQVMAWCRQAPSHYLIQCQPRSTLPYGMTRPQWVNCTIINIMIGQHIVLTKSV